MSPRIDPKTKNHVTREAGLKHVTSICAIVLFTSFCSFATGIDLRVGGGLNLSYEIYSGDYNLPDTVYKKRMHAGYNAGLSAAVYFTQQLGVISGLSYETRGFGYDVDDPVWGGPSSEEYLLNYLQIPVLFSYKPIPALSVNIGPELGVFLSGKRMIGDEDFDVEGIRPIDFGASLNVEYTFINKIAVGAGYYFGLIHNEEVSEGSFVVKGTKRHTNLKLYVAYVFHVTE